jgi:hypothetical protein
MKNEFTKLSKTELADLDTLIGQLQQDVQFVRAIARTVVKVTKVVVVVTQVVTLVTKVAGVISRTEALKNPGMRLLQGDLSAKELIELRKSLIAESRKK